MTTSFEELERDEDIDRIVSAVREGIEESFKPAGPYLTLELEADAWEHYRRQLAGRNLSEEAEASLRGVIDEVLDRVAERAIRDAGGA